MISLSSLKLIGLVGHAGVGKDTVGLHLHNTYENVYTEAFASPLKKGAAAAFRIPLNHFHDPYLKEQINEYWKVSPRQIAQFVGTEMFRDTVGKLIPEVQNDFWIRCMAGRLSGQLLDPEEDGEYEEGDTVVITDVRFQNEIDFITNAGGWIIEIDRPDHKGTVGIPNHPSESHHSLTYHNPERTLLINNHGTLQELYNCVDYISDKYLKLTKQPFPL